MEEKFGASTEPTSCRVVTWNCQNGIDKAWGTLTSLEADIVVIQEVDSHTEHFALAMGWSAIWKGTDPKGLAVIARPGLQLFKLEQSYPWSLPVRIEGAVALTVLGFWAMTPSRVGRSYTEQAIATFNEIDALQSPIVFAGDFNAWNQPQHLNFVKALEEKGLVSAYHKFNQKPKGGETHPTYYHQYRLDQPFHCDFVFVPDVVELRGTSVGTFEAFPGSKISDHVPVVVDLILLKPPLC